MIIRTKIDMKEPLTHEQEEMLERVMDAPPVPDEDCPDLTDEQLAQYKKMIDERREERNKQTVTLRLSPQALKTAKSLGKGYTSVLSRILESTLSDSKVLEQFL